MDFADDVTNNDEIEKRVRTLWVGNLHPKVSSRDIAELFYQVGPVEYVEFAYDENEICENFALVVFKYSSSVEDSLKIFKGTKLYGLPIITKNYSNHFEDPVFNEQLNYFKQLIKVEQNCQPNSPTECKWIDQSLDEKNIPESLPQPPMHEDHSHSKNHDNYDRRSSSKVNSSKYRHHTRNSKRQNSVNSGEYYPIDKSHHSQKHYKNSEHNSSSGSMEMFNYERDSYYNNPNNDRKHHDHTSFNRKESAYHNQEPMSTHEKHSGKDNNMLVRDLRDTMFRKRNRLDSNFHIDMNTNAGCTSLLDLRDTMYKNKNSRDLGQQNYESDSNNRWSERNQNIHGNSYLNKEPRKNNYNSERYSESSTKYQNNYADRSYNQDKSNNGIQEYGSEFPNNYNDGYRRDKNWRNNNKYNNPQNMESSSRQHNSYHPYKRNNEHSGHNRNKSHNRGGSDRSRHNYYS
ncbi:GATA zinc finger domain-containing protein 14-like [Rhopalosiphum padi]|uniref:GATA zinc finger domain-containing protein 14-like n=1 Tax=Rhopalosiphum padi TaxID=40932 RepID=UPI00298DA380|nr:GATA zinc finger domain-containing protein 14-like [Rhopalosiphum padi]XP_060849965.1 GATA zinc finger domain-containing protein 14-like [Rhopalosiphum padi]